MRVLAARWLAGGVAAASVALMAGSLALALADRRLVSARMAGWDDVVGLVTDLALPAVGFAAKYASASLARICLQAQDGTLRFTVSDDGTGYDARHTPMGSGLRNMADRLAALGGRLEVRSAPGQGTTITGHLPVPAASGNHQAPESRFGSVTQRA